MHLVPVQDGLKLCTSEDMIPYTEQMPVLLIATVDYDGSNVPQVQQYFRGDFLVLPPYRSPDPFAVYGYYDLSGTEPECHYVVNGGTIFEGSTQTFAHSVSGITGTVGDFNRVYVSFSWNPLDGNLSNIELACSTGFPGSGNYRPIAEFIKDMRHTIIHHRGDIFLTMTPYPQDNSEETE